MSTVHQHFLPRLQWAMSAARWRPLASHPKGPVSLLDRPHLDWPNTVKQPVEYVAKVTQTVAVTIKLRLERNGDFPFPEMSTTLAIRPHKIAGRHAAVRIKYIRQSMLGHIRSGVCDIL